MKLFNFPQKTFRNSDVMPSIPDDLLFFIDLKTLPNSSSFKIAPKDESETLFIF